jgi:nitrite reductase/ring-hydroxylating ferredoxin subunit
LRDPAVTRRSALAGVTVGGLGLPLLSACAGGSGGAAGGSPHGSPGDVLAAISDIPVGGGVVLPDHDVVVTRPDQGTFEGFSATCTHQGCLLSGVAAGTINCGCHGSQFAITNGANLVGPSGSPAGSVPPLPRVAVEVRGKNVVWA